MSQLNLHTKTDIYKIYEWTWIQSDKELKLETSVFESNALHSRVAFKGSIMFCVAILTVAPWFLKPYVMKEIQVNHSEGEKIQLTCEAEGVPRPVVTWYKDGREYHGSKVAPPVISPGPYNYKIQIISADHNHEGVYMCNVSNAFGWKTYNYTIKIVGKCVERYRFVNL